jgi:hypothetical protein
VTLRLRLGEAPQWPSFSSLYQSDLSCAQLAARCSRSLTQSVEFLPWCRADGVFTSGDGRACLRRCAPTQSLAPGPWGSNTPAQVSTPALTYQPPGTGQSSFEPGRFLTTCAHRFAAATCVCVLIKKTKNKKIVCVVELTATKMALRRITQFWMLFVCLSAAAGVNGEYRRPTFYSPLVGFNCARAPVLGVCVVYYISRVHLITLRTCTRVYPLG